MGSMKDSSVKKKPKETDGEGQTHLGKKRVMFAPTREDGSKWQPLKKVQELRGKTGSGSCSEKVLM